MFIDICPTVGDRLAGSPVEGLSVICPCTLLNHVSAGGIIAVLHSQILTAVHIDEAVAGTVFLDLPLLGIKVSPGILDNGGIVGLLGIVDRQVFTCSDRLDAVDIPGDRRNVEGLGELRLGSLVNDKALAVGAVSGNHGNIQVIILDRIQADIGVLGRRLGSFLGFPELSLGRGLGCEQNVRPGLLVVALDLNALVIGYVDYTIINIRSGDIRKDSPHHSLIRGIILLLEDIGTGAVVLGGQ